MELLGSMGARELLESSVSSTDSLERQASKSALETYRAWVSAPTGCKRSQIMHSLQSHLGLQEIIFRLSTDSIEVVKKDKSRATYSSLPEALQKECLRVLSENSKSSIQPLTGDSNE